MTAERNASRSASLPAAEHHLRSNEKRHVAEIAELIAIPTVSASGSEDANMERAAEYVAAALRRAGAPEVKLHRTAGHPIVLGGWPRPTPEAPMVLIYGHYDTQPAEPLDLWQTPPFQPDVRDGRIFGRGASDNKGPLMIPIFACEALTATLGRPPVGVTFMIEGEEEITSPNLPAFLDAHRDELAADAVISSDSFMWENDRPSLIRGCRGLLNMELHAKASTSDLHAGLFGGVAANAATALIHLLSTMISPQGEVTIDGFHDDVRETSESDRAVIEGLDIAFDRSLREQGVEPAHDVSDSELLMRNWQLPTLDVNGIYGGYEGEGPKAVIPAEARAKVSCRLVFDQTPDRVFAAVDRHVRRHVAPNVEVSLKRWPGGTAPFGVEIDHPVMAAAATALESVYGCPPLETWFGATLPFATHVDEVLGLKTILLGWGMRDENAHAPNEFLRLENVTRGARVYAELLTRLADGAIDHPPRSDHQPTMKGQLG